jgi:hypothetical protein
VFPARYALDLYIGFAVLNVRPGEDQRHFNRPTDNGGYEEFYFMGYNAL